MKKRFVTKTSKKSFKIIVYFILVIISFASTLSLLLDEEESLGNVLLNIMLKETTNESLIVDKLQAITNPNEMLYTSLNKIIEKNNLSVFSNIEHDNFSYEDSNSSYIEDPSPIKTDKPIVYIYNTHQTEEYERLVSYDYSIKPNVMIASYVLREKLNELGIPSMVETRNVKEYLDQNDLHYGYSYNATRVFMEEAKKENPTLTYFIDLHRDSVDKSIGYYEKDGKGYARILWVVGLDHENHEKNEKIADELNAMIEKDYPGLSRGVLKRNGVNVKSIYNQDVHPNTVLIEVGGVENLIEEVYNTCEVLAKYISLYIKEEQNEE